MSSPPFCQPECPPGHRFSAAHLSDKDLLDAAAGYAATHREEIDRFAEAVKGERIAILSRTYQETFLQLASSPVPGWREYIEARYFKA